MITSAHNSGGRCLAVALIALVAAGAARAQSASEAPSQEIKLKAAYVLNFLRFTTWPRVEGAPNLLLCVASAEDMFRALEAAVAGKKVEARAISVRAVTRAEPLSGCDALYASNGELPAAFPVTTAGHAMLTISDTDGFVHHGGMIGLFVEQNRLRFSVNLGQARRAGLGISSGLLELAVSVENRP